MPKYTVRPDLFPGLPEPPGLPCEVVDATGAVVPGYVFWADTDSGEVACYERDPRGRFIVCGTWVVDEESKGAGAEILKRVRRYPPPLTLRPTGGPADMPIVVGDG